MIKEGTRVECDICHVVSYLPVAIYSKELESYLRNEGWLLIPMVSSHKSICLNCRPLTKDCE